LEYLSGIFSRIVQVDADRAPWKVIFHMDNAAYHKKIEGLPAALSKLNKGQLEGGRSDGGRK
jgi:hypothetical protein